MKIPHWVNIVLLVLLATAFYTMVGQMVPQKEVPAPEVIEIAEDVSTEEMVEIGKGIAEGKGICLTCHTIGQAGSLRFPDLEGIGQRAEDRIPGMSGVEYLAQSLYEPDAYVVEGFNPGMPAINKPPIELTDAEILTVIAFLQSLGGTPTVTMDAKHAYNGGEGGDTVVETTAPAEVVATQDTSGRALFDQYGCAGCHTTAPADGSLDSLHDVGQRLDRTAILVSILDPDNITGLSESDRQRKREAMERAGVFDRATLQEIRLIVDFLAEQEAQQ